jgi:hypothetical protein
VPEELRERVMQDVSTVEWPDSRTIRQRAGRRRVRRVVAGCAAAVAVFAVAWTVLPPVGGDGSNRPADLARPAPGTLRGEDVGPGWRVDSWGHVESTEVRPDQGVQVTSWPPVEIAGCPAYRTAAPAGFDGHRGVWSIRADPPSAVPDAPVNEFVVGFADEAAATAVLDEARQVATSCATYDIARRERYTFAVAAENFAGDGAVRIDMTGVGIEHATGGSAGVPGVKIYVLVRVGRTVILLTSAGPTDATWLQSLAPAALNRLCAETGEC